MAERNDNIRLLEEMYKNAKMGCENINGVLPKVSDRFMIGELTDQFEHYGNYVGRVSELMHQRSAQPKEPGVMAKLGAKTGIVVNTMIDSTSSHVADMVAKGTRMGVETLEQTLAQCQNGCDAPVTGLCREMIDWEKTAADKMRSYIKD